jgi:hypothetical protein
VGLDQSRSFTYGRLRSAGGPCAVAPGAGLAGELAGDGQRGLPATNRDGESTEMKRRPRGSHLGFGRDGEAPEERIGGEGQSSGGPFGRRRCASEEGRRSGARSRGARGDPFIGLRGEEERTAWRWGAGSPAAAMNGGGALCGGRGKAEAARGECAPAP